MPVKYYAVVSGRVPGIYTTWGETCAQVRGYPGAIHKSFPTEAKALEYMEATKNTNRSNIGSTSTPTVLPVHDRTIVYTDGSSKNGIGGYGVIGIKPNGDIVELFGPLEGPIDENQTNQRAELCAIQVALEEFSGSLTIYTDSEYSIGCITQHAFGWKQSGWKKSSGEPVCNVDYIKAIDSMIESRPNDSIEFSHVRGHKGILYNEGADKLAEKGRLMNIELRNNSSQTR